MKKMSHTATHVRMIAKAMMSGRMKLGVVFGDDHWGGGASGAAAARVQRAPRIGVAAVQVARRDVERLARAWHPPPSMPSLFSEILTIINIVVPTAVGNGLEYLPVLIGMALVGHSQSPNTKI